MPLPLPSVGSWWRHLVSHRLPAQDALTYLAAVWCARQLPTELGAPDAQAKQLKKFASMRAVELGALASAAGDESGGGAAAAARQGRPGSRGEAARKAAQEEAAENGSLPGGLSHAEQRHHHAEAPAWEADDPAAAAAVAERGPQAEPELLAPGAGSGGSASLGSRSNGASTLAAASSAMAEGWHALREGWAYVSSRANRDVAALVSMKCAAALVWGAGASVGAGLPGRGC